MDRYTVITGTVTTAARGRDVLKRKGYQVSVVRTPPTEKNGCGYGITFSGNLENAKQYLKNAGVKILEITML